MSVSTKYLLRARLFFVWALCLAVADSGSAQQDAPIGGEAFGILAAFYDYDAKIPLEARVVELREEQASVRRKIVYRGARSFMVSANLEFPKQADPPYPTVLLLHGWSGSKESWLEKGNYISGGDAREALLEKGYALFSLDAQGHGDRIAENDYRPINIYEEPDKPGVKNYFTLREIVTQTVVDYRRGIDYLASRDDIDIARIGLLGYSMGGFQAVALTAVEPRIKLAAACVVPICWGSDAILNPANYAQGIGDRPFCLLMGSQDTMGNETQAKALYGLLKNPHTRLTFYDAAHRLPVAYVHDAVAFLADGI